MWPPRELYKRSSPKLRATVTHDCTAHDSLGIRRWRTLSNCIYISLSHSKHLLPFSFFPRIPLTTGGCIVVSQILHHTVIVIRPKYRATLEILDKTEIARRRDKQKKETEKKRKLHSVGRPSCSCGLFVHAIPSKTTPVSSREAYLGIPKLMDRLTPPKLGFMGMMETEGHKGEGGGGGPDIFELHVL